MDKYIYHGPTQHLSLKTGVKKQDGEDVAVYEDFSFIDGKPVSPPAENELVKTMIDTQMLMPVEDTTKPARKAKTTGGQTNA